MFWAELLCAVAPHGSWREAEKSGAFPFWFHDLFYTLEDPGKKSKFQLCTLPAVRPCCLSFSLLYFVTRYWEAGCMHIQGSPLS